MQHDLLTVPATRGQPLPDLQHLGGSEQFRGVVAVRDHVAGGQLQAER